VRHGGIVSDLQGGASSRYTLLELFGVAGDVLLDRGLNNACLTHR